jgi:hypothetical protein
MNAITLAPVFVNVTGEKKADRQLSVIRNASGEAMQALITLKGKVGAEIRDSFGRGGLERIALKAAWPTCDYKPFAEYVSARLGTPTTISNRAAFESFADRFSDMVATAKMEKVKKDGSMSNGYVVDKKTGALKPGARLAEAMELLHIANAVVKAATEISERNKAEADARKADADAPKLGE